MNKFEFEQIQKQFFNNLNNVGSSPLFVLVNTFNRVKNFYIKNIKIIYGVILTSLLIGIIGYFIFREPKGVYEITTQSGETYQTNDIELKDGCVFFNRTKNEKEIILCGDFKIEKNN
jgi:hypothetical protein